MSAAEVGLLLSGLRCAGCASRAEQALRGAPGVAEATVNFASHRAWVRFEAADTCVDALVRDLDELGIEARPYDPATLDRPAERESRAMLVRVLVAAFLAMNVMWLAIALYLGDSLGMADDVRRALRWLATALSLPAVSWCALPFWRGAWRGLRRGELTIDLPIVLGFGTAFATQVVGTLGEARHLYVDSAAVIVFLILLGRTLERRARARSSQALDRFQALAPKQALRIDEHGRVTSVAAEELRPGDLVRVPLGEACPADATVVGSAIETDESLLSGESRPVLRSGGDRVPAGARVVAGEGTLRVDAAAADGTIARIAGLLERATASRPRVQQLADRVAAHFAPAVLALAALTAIAALWSGVAPFDVALRATAVLIVACPCALGLATPAAVTAAIGRAAQLGILVKSGVALERLAEVDTLLVDKTGTLTDGDLAVHDVAATPGVSRDALLALAARVEGSTVHPIARAIRAAAPVSLDAELAERETTPGCGVAAEVDGRTLRVGRRSWLEALGIPLPSMLVARAHALAADGASLAWVARDERVLGVIALADRQRADAARAISGLRDAGLGIELVSGDHAAAARSVGAALAIPEVVGDATPETKVALVLERRRHGHVVAFVGDGVNDAAALGSADVGVGMAQGSDVTLHAADVVIAARGLTALLDIVGLARACRARIREGLGIALAYNAVAIPLAASGILTPLAAAIAMSLSSLVVTGNAIRLLGFASAQEGPKG